MKYFGAGGRPRSAVGDIRWDLQSASACQTPGSLCADRCPVGNKGEMPKANARHTCDRYASSPAAPRSPQGKWRLRHRCAHLKAPSARPWFPLRHARDDKFVYLPLAQFALRQRHGLRQRRRHRDMQRHHQIFIGIIREQSPSSGPASRPERRRPSFWYSVRVRQPIDHHHHCFALRRQRLGGKRRFLIARRSRAGGAARAVFAHHQQRFTGECPVGNINVHVVPPLRRPDRVLRRPDCDISR